MIREIKTTVWTNEDGDELVKLKPEDGTAYVACTFCNPEKLDDLAEACAKAAEALRLIEETKAEAGA